MRRRNVLFAILLGTSIAVPLIVLAENIPDFNRDGEINFSDFIMFAKHFGSSYGEDTYSIQYDLNRDGEIDLADFREFAAEFGTLTHADKAADNKQDTELRALALEEAAKEYRTSGNYAQAVIAYRRMLELSNHPLHRARGLNNLGRVYVEMDSLDLAAETFKANLAEYRESREKAIRFQVLWSNVHLARIDLLQDKEQRASLYFSQARLFLPKLETE